MLQRFCPIRTSVDVVVIVAHILIPYLLQFTSSHSRTESLFSHSNGIAFKMRQQERKSKGLAFTMVFCIYDFVLHLGVCGGGGSGSVGKKM